MIIELHEVELCSDMVTYSCKGRVLDRTFAEVQAVLARAGFRVATIPSRGTLIANRPDAMFLLAQDCRFDLSRLESRDHAAELVAELTRIEGEADEELLW